GMTSASPVALRSCVLPKSISDVAAPSASAFTSSKERSPCEHASHFALCRSAWRRSSGINKILSLTLHELSGQDVGLARSLQIKLNYVWFTIALGDFPKLYPTHRNQRA